MTLLAVLLPLTGTGQQSMSFNVEHLSVDQGLSHTTVNALIEDREGIIWAGTRFGLNRYDGFEFKLFLPQDGNLGAVRSHQVLCLREDRSGNIWTGYQDGGISIYERKTGQFRDFPEKANASVDWKTLSVRRIFEDSRGNLWIATYGAGAIVFDSAHQQIAQFCSYCRESNRQLSNDFVFDFEEDREGNIWIGSAAEGLEVFLPEENRLVKVQGRPGDRITGFGRELCLGREGNLWAGTPGYGLFEVSVAEKKVIRNFRAEPGGLGHDMITDLQTDREGRLWIATDGGGLSSLSEETGEWLQFQHRPDHPGSLNTDALYDIMFDRQGNLWLGTFNGGINLHRKRALPFDTERQYVRERLAGLGSVLSVTQDPGGLMWLGTDGAGLFRLEASGRDGKTGGFRLQPEPFPSDVLTCVLATPARRLWVGTYGRGLYWYDPQTKKTRHFLHNPADPGSLSHNNVWDLAMDSSGGIWVGTLGGGLNYLPPGGEKFRRQGGGTGSGTQLSGVQIVDILLDREERFLWVATENAGLNRLDTRTLQVVQYHFQPGNAASLSSDRLRCLFEDNEGVIWIGTEYTGLNRLDPESGEVVRLGKNEGFPSDMVNAIEQGPEGYLWISTQAGIIGWNPETKALVNVGSDPFLRDNQFNPKAVLKRGDNRLVFGSNNGYTIFLPSEVGAAQVPPGVMFTDLILSNQPVAIGRSEGRTVLEGPLNDPSTVVRLDYKDRGIQFLVTCSHAADAARWEYAYRLQNYDSDWQKVEAGRRSINYAGLPAGSYLLEVRAVGLNGQPGPVHAIRIEVAPPFWQTGWFYALCAVAGLLLAGGVLAYLLLRQRTFFQEKAMKADQEILQLRNENLEKDILNQRSRLGASLLQVAHKNELLNDLKAQIAALQGEKVSPQGIQRVIRDIDQELRQEDYWQQFQLVFNQTHTQFIELFQQRHPSLTDHEKRLCCFVRMQLSNREIAAILNITINAVEQAKYRIKKKLELDKDVSLIDYIREMGEEEAP